MLPSPGTNYSSSWNVVREGVGMIPSTAIHERYQLDIDHPNSTVLYKTLVSVLNRPFLHKQFSNSCHYFLLVCDSKSDNLSGHFFVSS